MRKAFEKAIEESPRCQATRFAYADWLMENGFDDEAHLQRTWLPERQDAWEWLEGFSKRCGYHVSNYEEHYRGMRRVVVEGQRWPRYEYTVPEIRVPMSMGIILAAAKEWAEAPIDEYSWEDRDYEEREYVEGEEMVVLDRFAYKDAEFVQQGDEKARNMMSDMATRKRFWECYQLVTGRKVDPKDQGRVFGCSC